MSDKFDNTLIFNLYNSRILVWVTVGLHGGALAIVCVLPIVVMLRISLLILLIASLFHVLSLHALRRAPHAVRTVALEGDGDWMLKMQNADQRGPCRLRSHFVHPWLVILQLRCPAARLPVNLVVAADSLDGETFRRLRARLNVQSWEE